MLLLGYVTGNGCIVMERRIWYNDLKEKVEKTQIINRLWMIVSNIIYCNLLYRVV